MQRVRRYSFVSRAALMTLVLAGCGAQQPATSSGPRVMFVEPTDGQTVSSPVHVKLAVDTFVVEPAGEVNHDHGHLHIMVDADGVSKGQVIPNDATHIHYGQGQLEGDLELAPDSQHVCLQAADGAHVALEGSTLQHAIVVAVE